jgi:uncharacterized SAM-binding protein YcdF (DUF218 family)
MKRKILIIGIISGIGVSIFLWSMIYVLTHAFIDTTQRSDAIVVLGTTLTKEEYPCLVSRVQHAAELSRQGMAPVIIFAGGKEPVDYAVEATVMKKIGLSEHIPDKRMLLEGQSHTTYEDLLDTKSILAKNHLHSIIIVTDPYHEPRAALLAQKDGMPYTLSPATKSSCSQQFPKNLKLLFHESLGIIYYKVTGKL